MSDLTPVQQTNTFGPPQAATIFKKQKTHEKQKQARRDLWQDKDRAERGPLRTPQPGPKTIVMRAPGTNNSVIRPQNNHSPKHNLEKVSSWLEPILKSNIQLYAQRDGLSVSATINAIIKKHYETDAHMRYAGVLEPILERTIDRKLSNRDSRVIALLVRTYDSGQARSIVTNILGLQPDIEPTLLRDIIAESDKKARSNIMKKTGQITELIEAFNKGFFATDRGEENSNS